MAMRLFTNAILTPAVLLISAGLLTWQLAIHTFYPLVGEILAVLWAGALIVGRFARLRQRDGLLTSPPRVLSRAAQRDLRLRQANRRPAAHEGSYQPTPVDDQIAQVLRSRRLVILCGELGSGRSRTAFHALQNGFAKYKLLTPARPSGTGKPPLTTLLTSSMLSPFGRYALWLDDVGDLIERGFDPRIVERWLAVGIGRVAIGTITPAEREHILSTETPVANALERAAFIEVEGLETRAELGQVARRYQRLASRDPQGQTLVRIVAACELLGLAPRTEATLDKLLRRLTRRGLTTLKVRSLSIGDHALLGRSDGKLIAHPEVLAVVDREFAREVGTELIQAVIESTEMPAGLLAIGQALTVRGFDEESEIALAKARRIGHGPIQKDVAGAWARLFDLRIGASGATLSNAGGLDFAEPMGLSQRASSEALLPVHPHGGFDPTIPPEQDGWTTRAYRLTVHRGAVRFAVLVALDVLAILAASVAALAVRAAARHSAVDVVSDNLLQLVVPGSLVTVSTATWLGLYRADRPRARPQLILATMAIVSVLVAAAFLVARVDVGSIAALLVLFGVAFITDCTLRYLYDLLSRRWVRSHRLQPRALILGSAAEAYECATRLTISAARPVQCVAFLSPVDRDDPFRTGDYSALEKMIHELHIHEIIIADRSLTTAEKAELIDRAHRFGLDVRFTPSEEEIILGAVGRVADDGLVHVPAALLSPEALALKRMVDSSIVLATMPIWGAIIGAYALYSRLRRRGQPIFVTTNRVGLGGTGFTMVRLRTRHKHADNSRGTKPTGRIEAFVECTGLDELPQVANVLRNEMALVGPRPLAAQDLPELSAAQLRTLGVRPGMTGRWQLAWTHGLSESDMRTMDAEYLRRWRLSHDLDTLLRTPIVIIRRRFYLNDTELHKHSGSGWSTEPMSHSQ